MPDETLTETPDEKAFFESGGATAPEPQAEDTDAPAPAEPKAEDKEKKYVPIDALHEERMRRKELQEQMRQAEDRRAKMESRFEDILRRLQPQQPEAKAPDWDTQPIDAGKHTAQEVESVKEKLARLEQKEQADNQQRAFLTRYAASAHEFQQTHADFQSAYQYWTAHVAQELDDAGWKDPAAVAEQVQNYERALVAKAFQDGVNPAERLYNVAKRRGYSSKAPDSVKISAEQKVETLQKGAEAAKSLSAAGGGTPAPLTLESLAEMDDDDFDRNWDKVMKAANRRR